MQSERRNSLEMLLPGGFTPVPSEKIIEVPLSSITANPFQVRKEFSEESIRELADSIGKNGLMQPIIVRLKNAEPVAYEIVAGERRVRAHQTLGKETIKAIIREVEDGQMRILALVENLQREDLKIVDKANGFVALMKESGFNQKQAYEALGISERTSFLYTKIGKADQEYKEIISKNDLDIRTSDFLISLANKIRKGKNPEEIQSFDRELRENQVDKEFLEQLHTRYLSPEVPEENESKSSPTSEAKTKKQSLWKMIKAIETAAEAGREIQMTQEQKYQLAERVGKFFKALGIKKFEVKFK